MKEKKGRMLDGPVRPILNPLKIKYVQLLIPEDNHGMLEYNFFN